MTGDMHRCNDSKLVLVGSLTARDTIRLQILNSSTECRAMFHRAVSQFRLSTLLRVINIKQAKKKSKIKKSSLIFNLRGFLHLLFNK